MLYEVGEGQVHYGGIMLRVVGKQDAYWRKVECSLRK